MKTLFPAVLMCCFLAACGHYTQTTSGRDYLQKYNQALAPGQPAGEGITEDQIRQAASVEPVLAFPARIGLARIENGNLTAVPGVEAEAWMKAAERLGPDFGTFVPVSPLVAEMVSPSQERPGMASRMKGVIQKIRLGAARQHLDAVLIYEVYANTDSRGDMATAIAATTVIGTFLVPSRTVEVEGFANALLIDVVQGYPYGTVNVTLDKEKAHAHVWNEGRRGRELSVSVKNKTAVKLTREVEEMFRRLRRELAEKQVADAAK